MPREKELTKLIPKIYRRHAEDIALFFFVKAQKQVFPTLTVERGIQNYFRFANVTEDEWDLLSAVKTYTRMQQEFIEFCREDTKTHTGDPR